MSYLDDPKTPDENIIYPDELPRKFKALMKSVVHLGSDSPPIIDALDGYFSQGITPWNSTDTDKAKLSNLPIDREMAVENIVTLIGVFSSLLFVLRNPDGHNGHRRGCIGDQTHHRNPHGFYDALKAEAEISQVYDLILKRLVDHIRLEGAVMGPKATESALNAINEMRASMGKLKTILSVNEHQGWGE